MELWKYRCKACLQTNACSKIAVVNLVSQHFLSLFSVLNSRSFPNQKWDIVLASMKPYPGHVKTWIRSQRIIEPYIQVTYPVERQGLGPLGDGFACCVGMSSKLRACPCSPRRAARDCSKAFFDFAFKRSELLGSSRITSSKKKLCTRTPLSFFPPWMTRHDTLSFPGTFRNIIGRCGHRRNPKIFSPVSRRSQLLCPVYKLMHRMWARIFRWCSPCDLSARLRQGTSNFKPNLF